LNGPEALEAARAFADRVTREAGFDPVDRIERAFGLAFQRVPEAPEREAAERFLARTSLPELCRALLNANEFAYLD
jgi:hypothetical protein